jgi:hypothetical protein
VIKIRADGQHKCMQCRPQSGFEQIDTFPGVEQQAKRKIKNTGNGVKGEILLHFAFSSVFLILRDPLDLDLNQGGRRKAKEEKHILCFRGDA